jgi:hypothetical protein
MNNIPKENFISRVLPSDPLKKNDAHERTASLLSTQQNPYKDQKGYYKHPLPSRILRILLAKLVSTLHGNNSPFAKTSYSQNYHNPKRNNKK